MPTNTELRQQIFDAINAHDVEALRAMWADGVEERFPDKTCRGKDELAAYFKDLFAAMPDFHMEKVSPVEEGETVFARWTLTATHTAAQFNGIDPTGKAVTLDGFDQITFRDGRCVETSSCSTRWRSAASSGCCRPTARRRTAR
jgi:steroid delta-isomerase-like uncharacterized protein